MIITEGDINRIVKDTVMLVLERMSYSEENICYSPYRVAVSMSDHSIDREFQRDIKETDIMEMLRMAVRQIIDDVAGDIVHIGEKVKIINKENCIVVVVGVTGNRMKRKIDKLVVVTCYIWDGRFNIDLGNRYYVGEESPLYREAKQWNKENQGKVIPYMEWKRMGTDLDKNRRKAERDYYFRTHNDLTPEKRMELINRTYDSEAEYQRRQIHNAMGKEELNAVRDYYKDVDRKPLSSKGSANRDLRAMDLIRKRKEQRYENN